MTDYMINFEFIGLKRFIKAYFYGKKAPIKVLSLKKMAECRMLVIFLLKRIDLIVDLQLETEEMREHPEKYEPKEKYQNIMDLLKKNQLRNVTFEYATFKSDEILKTNLIRNMTHELNLSLPAMYTLTMLKLSDDYKYIPSCIQDK